MDSVLALHPAAPGSNPGIPKANLRLYCLEQSRQQRLIKVDRTHLVLWLVASWYYKKMITLTTSEITRLDKSSHLLEFLRPHQVLKLPEL